MVALEGVPVYTTDGDLLDRHYRWTRKQVRGLIRSLKVHHGVDVEWSESAQDTVDLITEYAEWVDKGVHRSLLTRPKPQDAYGNPLKGGSMKKRDLARHLLQGFPGIGVARAEALFDAFGRIPLGWTVTQGELAGVPGIGKKTSADLVKYLESN